MVTPAGPACVDASERIAARFGPGAVSAAGHGTVIADVPARRWIEALTFARDVLGCGILDWLSAVDELTDGYAIMVHVYPAGGRLHLLLRTRVAAGTARLPTATQVYPAAAGYERATERLFGIRFDGHPGRAPSLLPEEDPPQREKSSTAGP